MKHFQTTRCLYNFEKNQFYGADTWSFMFANAWLYSCRSKGLRNLKMPFFESQETKRDPDRTEWQMSGRTQMNSLRRYHAIVSDMF